MQPKLLVFDLDGTAIPNDPQGYPSRKVIAAVRAAQKKVKVSVATGRELSLCKPILKAFSIVETSIISGGTQLYNPLTERIEWEQKLSRLQVAAILNACRHFPYHLGVADEIEIPLLARYHSISEKTIMYIMNVPNNEEPPILAALSTVPDITVQLVVAWEPNCHDVHIFHKDASKRHALAILLDTLSIKPNEVMVVGDGGNDLPLFDFAGIKVAMGNGSEQLKAAADYIAPPVDQDGLAVAIEKYIL